MLMGDYGLKLYSNAIIVNAKFAAENPEAVKGFLRAFLKGLKDTVANPTHAIELVLRRNEDDDCRNPPPQNGRQGLAAIAGGQTGSRP